MNDIPAKSLTAWSPRSAPLSDVLPKYRGTADAIATIARTEVSPGEFPEGRERKKTVVCLAVRVSPLSTTRLVCVAVGLEFLEGGEGKKKVVYLAVRVCLLSQQGWYA